MNRNFGVLFYLLGLFANFPCLGALNNPLFPIKKTCPEKIDEGTSLLDDAQEEENLQKFISKEGGLNVLWQFAEWAGARKATIQGFGASQLQSAIVRELSHELKVKALPLIESHPLQRNDGLKGVKQTVAASKRVFDFYKALFSLCRSHSRWFTANPGLIYEKDEMKRAFTFLFPEFAVYSERTPKNESDSRRAGEASTELKEVELKLTPSHWKRTLEASLRATPPLNGPLLQTLRLFIHFRRPYTSFVESAEATVSALAALKEPERSDFKELIALLKRTLESERMTEISTKDLESAWEKYHYLTSQDGPPIDRALETAKATVSQLQQLRGTERLISTYLAFASDFGVDAYDEAWMLISPFLIEDTLFTSSAVAAASTLLQDLSNLKIKALSIQQWIALQKEALKSLIEYYDREAKLTEDVWDKGFYGDMIKGLKTILNYQE